MTNKTDITTQKESLNTLADRSLFSGKGCRSSCEFSLSLQMEVTYE